MQEESLIAKPLAEAQAQLEEWQATAQALYQQISEAEYQIAFYQGKIAGILAATAPTAGDTEQSGQPTGSSRKQPESTAFTVPFARRPK